MKKPRFKCVTCSGPTKHVWTSENGKVVALQCVDGHREPKKEGEPKVKGKPKDRRKVHPVFLVPAEEA